MFNKIILGLLFFIFVFFSLGTYQKPLNAYQSTFNKIEETITTSRQNELKILQLSDIQLSNFWSSFNVFAKLKKYIKSVSPDIIVLTGDIVEGKKSLTPFYVVDFFESLQIPWAPVFGNHDYETSLGINNYAKLLENAKYCMFKTGDVSGFGNYCYTYKINDNDICSFFFMDSQTYATYKLNDEIINGQAYIMPDQINWYENKINSIKAKNGTVVPSLMFFHIPVEEYVTAYNKYVTNEISGTGSNKEPICVQTSNAGLFQKVVELNSTKAILVGHDHTNNTMLDYQGVKLCYGLKSSTCSYYNAYRLGGTVVTVNSNGSLSIEHKYANYLN